MVGGGEGGEGKLGLCGVVVWLNSHRSGPGLGLMSQDILSGAIS